jgi:hypothetical protein
VIAEIEDEGIAGRENFGVFAGICGFYTEKGGFVGENIHDGIGDDFGFIEFGIVDIGFFKIIFVHVDDPFDGFISYLNFITAQRNCQENLDSFRKMW